MFIYKLQVGDDPREVVTLGLQLDARTDRGPDGSRRRAR